jgi:hypothetical protein
MSLGEENECLSEPGLCSGLSFDCEYEDEGDKEEGEEFSDHSFEE